MAIRTTTWENLGTINTKGGNKLPDEMKFTVHKEPLGFMSNGVFQQIDGYDTVVDERGHGYGPVSKNYGLVSNEEALGFIENIDDLEIKKYGHLNNGMQFIIGALADVNVLGDKFTPYLIFRNSFNGRYPLQMTICPLRIVCQNQLNMAFRQSENTINIRHTSKAIERVAEAQRVMMGTEEYLRNLNKEAERYANIKLSDPKINSIIDQLFPIADNMTDASKEKVQARITQFKAAMNAEDLRNFKGTAWNVIQAFADAHTHAMPARVTKKTEENQFLTITFDSRPFLALANMINAVA